MKSTELLGEAQADGSTITLTRHDREFLILAAGKPLMSSRMHGSEQALATFGCRHQAGGGAHACAKGILDLSDI